MIFLNTALHHFSAQTIQYAASQGVPMAFVAVPLSGVLATAGGLMILLGFKARVGAWLLIIFLIPVTLMMHNFWAVADPQMHQIQLVNFIKNLSLLGAAFMIAYFGSGPFSIDNK